MPAPGKSVQQLEDWSLPNLKPGGGFPIPCVIHRTADVMFRQSLPCKSGDFVLMFASGHGPIRWHPLMKLFNDFNQSYGAGTVEIVHAISVLPLPKLKKKTRAGLER